MSASPIDANWKEAITFLRRQFVIGRCYAPCWWWATIPLMVVQPAVLFGGVLLATVMAWQGRPLCIVPAFVSAALYGMAMLRGEWRQDTWSARINADPTRAQAAARFDRWAAPWTCLFAAGVMLVSAVGRTITWRGVRYHIGPAGRITLLGRVPNDERRGELLARQFQWIAGDCADSGPTGGTPETATGNIRSGQAA
jgi:hypothetical protein